MVLEPTTVTFNPFTFRFATGELRLLSESGTVFMSLESLLADVAPASLFRLSVLCDSVTIKGLDLNLAREQNGSYNFQQIFGIKENKNQLPMVDFADLPFFFSLNNISISDSRITFNDAPAGKIHTVAKIQLELPTFSNSPFQTEQYLRPHFSAVVNGSPVELTGQTRMGEADSQNQTTNLSLNLHDLDLTIYSGYLPFTLPMEFRKGTADGKLDLVFNPQNKGGDKLTIGFQLRISEAELNKKSGSVIVAVPTARLSGNLQPISRKLHFTEVAIKNPTVNSFGNFSQEKSTGAGDQAEQATAPDIQDGPPYELGLDLLLVDNGTVRLHPGKDSAQQGSTWHSIQLSMQKYRSVKGKFNDQQSGTLSVSGEKEGSSSSFSWQGTFSSPESISGDLTLLKMDCGSLLQAVSSNHPFKLQGTTDLRGRFTLSAADAPPSPFNYELTDTEVTIKDFALIDNDKNILTAEAVKLSPVHLVDKTVDFGNVHFQQGSAQLPYGRLPESFGAVTTPAFRLQGIDFSGKVTFSRPENPDHPLIFTDVSLKANQLNGTGQATDNLSFSGKTTTGGLLKAQGNVRFTPFALAVKTGFRDLPATDVWPLFTASPKISLISGKLSGQGMFELPDTRFAGELQLTDGTSNGPQKTMVSWQKSVLRDMQYSAAPFHLGIASIEIDEGRFPWEITGNNSGPVDYFTDIIKYFLPSGDTLDPGNTPTGAPFIDIKEISFTKGRISIHDRRLTPDWQGEMADLAGKINHIQSPGAKDKSTFTFSGKLDNVPFTIHGAVDLFSQEKNGTWHFSLENYPLASFYQQLAAKTYIDPSDGEVRLALDGRWRDQLYINSGKLTLTNLKPAATSDFAVPLALLSGTDDTVQLPFDFSRTDPVAANTIFDEFLTSFQTKIIKGSVSPLLLAGDEFSDLIGNEFIEFHPGQFMISPSGQRVLDLYGALLNAHPQVGLILSGGINRETDSQAMMEHLSALEQQRVALENEKLMQQWQEKKARYQKNLAELQKTIGPGQKILEQNIPADILAGFSPIQPVPIVIDDAMLLELAQKRINIVSQYFTTERALQPGRISVMTPDILDGISESPTSGVSISLKVIDR
jgi:hypothetical protein